MLIFNSELSNRLNQKSVTENASEEEEEFFDEEELSEETLQFVKEAALHILLEEQDKEELIDEGEIDDMEESGEVMESTVVRLDRDSRLRQLTRVISYRIAREKKDPNFAKLLRIWRIERNLEDKVNRKYESQAKRIAAKELRENYKQVGRRFVKVRGKGVGRKTKGNAHRRKSRR